MRPFNPCGFYRNGSLVFFCMFVLFACVNMRVFYLLEFLFLLLGLMLLDYHLRLLSVLV